MITPSFGLTATERVLPKLAFDFTTASLDSRITFTRTTDATHPATYVDSSGVITAATNNQPRFDYDPLTLACKGLLIEESRTNICLQSQNLNTTWVKSGSSVSENVVVSPDGTQNADQLICPGGGFQMLYQDIAVTSGQTYTLSFYAKSADSNNTPFRAWVEQVGGTATVITPTQSWVRYTVTVTAPDTSVRTAFAVPSSGAAVNVYIWGAQLEAGAFATSYIPTTTTALTRNADVATMTGTNFSDWYNASEGTAQAQFIFGTEPGYASGGSSQRIFEFSDGSTNNRWLMYRNEAVSDRIYYLDASGGSLVVNTSADTTNTTSNTVYKAAMAAKNSSFAAAFNGNTPATFSSGNISTGVNQLFLGKALSNGFLNGWLQKFNYYPQRMTNAEVQAISK